MERTAVYFNITACIMVDLPDESSTCVDVHDCGGFDTFEEAIAYREAHRKELIDKVSAHVKCGQYVDLIVECADDEGIIDIV